MPSTVLVGTQWGDEGKGKICDLIAPEFDCVVRYQGGNNAGHTIVVGDKKYGLHQVPSGIMYPDCVSVIGNGCVVNPAVLLEEIDMFEGDGISTANLKVSGNAHVIMPYHVDLDGAYEELLGKNNIGTTKRGIGPCYQDKMARIGIRMQDLMDEATLREKLEIALARVNPQLERIFDTPGASGADLANIINEGALRAVRLGRKRATQEDFEESVEVVIAGQQRKSTVLSDHEKQVVAYHEIGHAIVAARQKGSAPVTKITIVPRTSGALGYTMQVEEDERFLTTKQEVLDKLAVYCGGRAAEELIFGEMTSAR